jgi:hypothetical protein
MQNRTGNLRYMLKKKIRFFFFFFSFDFGLRLGFSSQLCLVVDFNCKALLALPVCVFHSVCSGIKHFPVFGATRNGSTGSSK